MSSGDVVYALMGEEPDTYDVGTHSVVLQLFTNDEQAEHVLEMLVGPPKDPVANIGNWARWELEIEEVTVR